MIGPFVHHIDPVIGRLDGLYLWWYGLSYTLGFLEVHIWLRRARRRLELSLGQVYDLTLLFAVFVLLGGRLVEVAPSRLVLVVGAVAHVPEGVVLISILTPALGANECVILDSFESQMVSIFRVLERLRFEES